MPFRLTAGNIYLFGEVKHVRSQSSVQDIGDRFVVGRRELRGFIQVMI